MQEFLSRYPYHSPVSRTDVCLSVCLSVSVGLCSCFFLVCLCSHFAVHFCGSVTAVNSRCDATLILTTSSELSPERERERERERAARLLGRCGSTSDLHQSASADPASRYHDADTPEDRCIEHTSSRCHFESSLEDAERK